MSRKKVWLSLEDAIAAVAKMKPNSLADYRARRHEYPGLPVSPSLHYGDEYPGWGAFTSGCRSLYQSVEEAKAVVLALGVKNFSQYSKRRHEDPKLPANPRKFYGSSYPGHDDFFARKSGYYSNLAAASEAAIALGIFNSRVYREKYALDPRLPRYPHKMYKDEWGGWPQFLRYDPSRKGAGKYQTYKEFEKALRALGIKGQKDFKLRRHEDPMMPGHPDEIYGQDWPGWKQACGVSIYLLKCDTWQEAREVASQYFFSSAADYKERCGVDARLPKYPHARYKNFPGWDKYLLPDILDSFIKFKCAVRYLKITSARHYREILREYPHYPKKPSKEFKSEWTSWEDVLGLPPPYTFEELREISSAHGCRTMKEYRSLVREIKDLRMPLHPETHYEEWVNSRRFLSKVEPYSLDFIDEQLRGWVSGIREWLVGTRSAVPKETSLCRFLRHFIGPYQLGKTAHEFLFMTGIDIKPFKELLDQQASQTVGRSLLRHVNEYLNHVLKTELTIEDEETGENVRVGNASNPFAHLEHAVTITDNARPSESVKPALAYQYVENLKLWIVPQAAKHFSELRHIQGFDSDYIEVDEAIIDPQDPDCIYKVRDGRYFIWCPVYWMHTYALVSIPARGRQIAYNDSGEADDYIGDIVEGEVVWVKNTGKLAGWKPNYLHSRKSLHRREGFMQMGDNGWGMYFTSNKTGFQGAGYKVDWAPDALVYWMVKLRKWQEKYNSINEPFPWEKCVRTVLNRAQLIAKGANCFLFRAFGEGEPAAYSARSSERLAAALYYSQPRDLVLATFLEGGSHSTLSRYDSKYTPHSMRVSLISAYVFEFGLPIEVVMKLAGHTSIVMNIYYAKIGGEALRRRIGEGEKKALQQESYAAQDMIEQGRVDALRHQLIATSENALEMLRSGYAGSNLVRDYGICPYAAGRCEDGGALVGATQVRLHTPYGYLGMQNCPRCRHFITGPMFLGGLLSQWNEISLRMTLLSERYADFDTQIKVLELEVQKFDEEEYDLVQAGVTFDGKARNGARVEIRKLQSEQESTAKKMDMFLCDLQALTKHINECREIISRNEKSNPRDTELMLVVQESHEIDIDIEDTSLFQQLHEVCINATIFQSATADFAVPRRSLMLDKMALMNDLRPGMCSLTEKEQLLLGNQVTKFLFGRVKSWERVDMLVEGKLLLADLTGAERIEKSEMQTLLESKPIFLGTLAQAAGISVPYEGTGSAACSSALEVPDGPIFRLCKDEDLNDEALNSQSLSAAERRLSEKEAQ